ncbi:DNA primase TraC [Labrenzia sp. THAF82]|uniref:DUF5710 domain-containing protein n=1 Tax=Labrenzia sp. THAF82 TaxID=2587861 RepID=UPI0012683B80|nr:DUF5710 domain-containing protein [Labrenzia sp. THAF82]QFT29574.1 DNA primase TraC [Labrenzia sp. THAF82]
MSEYRKVSEVVYGSVGVTWLSVPYEDREIAKAAGALWDSRAKSWFVRGLTVPDALVPYLPQNRPSCPGSDPHRAFAAFLRAQGAELDGAPRMDGQWHRVKLAGDARGKNGSYRGFLDGVPNGQFRNFKGDGTQQWTGVAVVPCPEDRPHLEAQAARQRAEREQELLDAQSAAARRAFGIWTNLKTSASPDTCAYLARKGVEGYGVKVADDGRLVIPLRDDKGHLWSLQFVGEAKTYLKGRRKSGLYHTIDPAHLLAGDNSDRGVLTVFVAFDADNLVKTATSVRELFPHAGILIAADNDHHLPHRTPALPNKGLVSGHRAAEAVGGTVLVPSFTAEEKEGQATDWNDLKAWRGEDALVSALQDGIRRMLPEPEPEFGPELGADPEDERDAEPAQGAGRSEGAAQDAKKRVVTYISPSLFERLQASAERANMSVAHAMLRILETGAYPDLSREKALVAFEKVAADHDGLEKKLSKALRGRRDREVFGQMEQLLAELRKTQREIRSCARKLSQ